MPPEKLILTRQLLRKNTLRKFNYSTKSKFNYPIRLNGCLTVPASKS